MRSKIGAICMILGAVLLLGALSLFLYNQHVSTKAGEASAQVMSQLTQIIEDHQQATDPQTPTGSPETSPSVPVLPDPLDPGSLEMTEVEIDGNRYIGYLSIPSRGLELPVMADWDYDKLEIAPCRFAGTLKGENLVILGHNYRRHFRPLQSITVGERVYFVDTEGTVTAYEVVAIDVLAPTAVEEMTAGDYDLTLFTCTFGGKTRLTICCDLVKGE